MLAVVHGNELNLSQLGKSLGVSHPTVRTYLDFLEGAFLFRLLPPFSANLKKRLVKRPKLYWRDTGLLHALQRVSDMDQLLIQPWVGNSWEGYVVEQILLCIDALGHTTPHYHFRTSDGYELDLVLEMGTQLWAIEVKLSANPSKGDLDRLNKTADMIGAHRRFLISRTTETIASKTTMSSNLPSFLGQLMPALEE